MLVRDQALQDFDFVDIQPVVDRVGIPDLEQAVLSHPVRGLPPGNFQQGGTAFPHIGTGIVVAMVGERAVLLFGQAQGATLGHRELLSPIPYKATITQYIITGFDRQISLDSDFNI